MKVIECKLCGYQEPDLELVQSLTSCGDLPAICCPGCHSLTSHYHLIDITGELHQPKKKSEGFTLDEINQMATDTCSRRWTEEAGVLHNGESPIYLERKWKDNPWQKLVILRQSDSTHPYTVYKEMEDDTWSIDIIYPNISAIIGHYRCLGGIRLC